MNPYRLQNSYSVDHPGVKWSSGEGSLFGALITGVDVGQVAFHSAFSQEQSCWLVASVHPLLVLIRERYHQPV
jgi:hypothetical protein